MVFKWTDYLELARDLDFDLDNRREERRPFTDVDIASIRCCVSRAYYAAYWKCRRYLENDLGITIRNRDAGLGSHEFVVNKLGEEDSELSQDLDRLKNSRVLADYKLQHQFNQSDGKTAIMRAASIIKRIENLQS